MHVSLLPHHIYGLLLILCKLLKRLQLRLEHHFELCIVPAINSVVVFDEVELLGNVGTCFQCMRQHSLHPLLERDGFGGRGSFAVEKEDILLFWALDVVAQERKEL